MSDIPQTAVVTGASRGFGPAIAAGLVAAGAAAVLEVVGLVADPGAATEYQVSGAGLRPVG